MPTDPKSVPVSVCAFAWGISLLAHATATFAQRVPEIPLKPANASLDADFVGISSLREIADGRVIVTDGYGQQLYLADFREGRASLLGRKGRGPGEWLRIGRIHALSGDSSILHDASNGRFLLFDGARAVGTLQPDRATASLSLASQMGSDRLGHLLARQADPADAGKLEFTRADSSVLVRVSAITSQQDTITKLRERPRRGVRDGRGMVFSPSEPDAEEERAHLFADGWIAVVRLEPLRVDWRSPTGQWTHGAPFTLRRAPVDARERRAIEASRQRTRDNARRMGMPESVFPAMPTSIPVMAASVVLRGTPEGRLLVRRSTSVAIPAVRYLVINRSGVIDGEITLGATDEVVGFGPRSIYIASKDEDDAQRLRRHPWP